MPEPKPAPAPPETLEAFCLAVLRDGDLETKLRTPTTEAGKPLPDDPSGPIRDIERPARGAGLTMGPGGAALPPPSALDAPDARRDCLARFAHHELQAVEYFAWALLRWPAAPPELRRGLVSALVDEQRHCRLYLDRLAALGGHFDTDDHSDYFWQQAPAIANAPHGLRAFLSAMGLTLEQANLDFTLTYRDAFRAAGDEESAAICQVVHDDEIAHVALALRWLERLSESVDAESNVEVDADLQLYLETVPFPLGPARAKGRRFEVEPRRRAGLSEAMIEHVREARVQERDATPIDLIPNLGAEEGEDLRAYREQAPVRTAAHLWMLLFPRRARLLVSDEPGPRGRDLWPPDLGAPPTRAAFDFLDRDETQAWLDTAAARDACAELAGPGPGGVAALHDKAFAVEASEVLGLLPRRLAPLIEVYSPDRMADADAMVAELRAKLAEWPDWTGGCFTLKPRFGSSGRGRVGGTGSDDLDRVRGALPRLAARGGAIFEPWLDRVTDLSVVMHVSEPVEGVAPSPLTLLGSLEMWNGPGGGYRGHFGEIDHRGRVFSGDADDEALRADAAAVASLARERGFKGPCGVDALRYVEPDATGAGVPRLRGAGEFNARATMGLVAIGLVKRALPRVRKRLALAPGERHGFALTYRPAADDGWRRRVYEQVGNDAVIVDLSEASLADDPRASLVFARNPASIREARASAFHC